MSLMIIITDEQGRAVRGVGVFSFFPLKPNDNDNEMQKESTNHGAKEEETAAALALSWCPSYHSLGLPHPATFSNHGPLL